MKTMMKRFIIGAMLILGLCSWVKADSTFGCSKFSCRLPSATEPLLIVTFTPCKVFLKVRNRVGLPDMSDALLHRLQSGKSLPVYNECALEGDVNRHIHSMQGLFKHIGTFPTGNIKPSHLLKSQFI